MFSYEQMNLRKIKIFNLIESQKINEKEKLLYQELLEDFFTEINIKKILKKKSLTEKDLFLELTLEFLNFAKHNVKIATDIFFSELKLSKNSNCFLTTKNSFLNSKNLILKKNKVEKKRKKIINIDNFDQIKTNVRYFINKIEFFEREKEKVVSLDSLLSGLRF